VYEKWIETTYKTKPNNQSFLLNQQTLNNAVQKPTFLFHRHARSDDHRYGQNDQDTQLMTFKPNFLLVVMIETVSRRQAYKLYG